MGLDVVSPHRMTNPLVIDLDHVQIAAPKGCEADARELFDHLLGLEEIEKAERSRGGFWFKLGPQQLHVGVETHLQPATRAYPAFAVLEIDLLFCTLTSGGTECDVSGCEG